MAKDSGNWKFGGRFRVNNPNKGLADKCAENDGAKGWHALQVTEEGNGTATLTNLNENLDYSSVSNGLKHVLDINITKALSAIGQSVGEEFLKALHLGAFMKDYDGMALQIAAMEILRTVGEKDEKLCKKTPNPLASKKKNVDHFGINCTQIDFADDIAQFVLNISVTALYDISCADYQKHYEHGKFPKNVSEAEKQDQVDACAQAFGVHGSHLICYKSKMAKDSGNWKFGGRFRVNNPNKGLADKCAGNDGTKGWHALQVTEEGNGTATLTASFCNLNENLDYSSVSNGLKHVLDINITKALSAIGQSVGEEFLKALHLGAFMKDYDGMALQIAAMEILRTVGEKDEKLCKKTCSAAKPTEKPMATSTEKTSTKVISTTPNPLASKKKNVDHFGINCTQIDFADDIAQFVLNISVTALYDISCADYQKHYEHGKFPKNVSEVEKQDQVDACAQVPTASFCNETLALYACFQTESKMSAVNKEIAQICQNHLGISMRGPTPCDVLGDDCELVKEIEKKIADLLQCCSPTNPGGPCICSLPTPDPREFTVFPPSAIIEPVDTQNEKPDIVYTKEQAQEDYEGYMKACAECAPFLNESHRAKRQAKPNLNKWTKFPIAIKFSETLGKNPVAWEDAFEKGTIFIQKDTCINFTTDLSHGPDEGIEVVDDGSCGKSSVGKTAKWQQLWIHCTDGGSVAHELLHALGLKHEHQRDDARNYIIAMAPKTNAKTEVTQIPGDARNVFVLEDSEERIANLSKRTATAWIFRVLPKDGKKVRIHLKMLNETLKCEHPCKQSYVEVKYRKDKRASGARLCCSGLIRLETNFAKNWIEADGPNVDIIISSHIKTKTKTHLFALTYETDGAKLVSSNDCPEGANYDSKRNPGHIAICDYDPLTGAAIPCCPRGQRREGESASFWGYWKDKSKDPIRIDDFQCLSYEDAGIKQPPKETVIDYPFTFKITVEIT
uniref:ZnMc domain-containing protein n=1 Tax=Globodera pallida TaxID=36090 RepID=A0A183C1V7_GLOPA